MEKVTEREYIFLDGFRVDEAKKGHKSYQTWEKMKGIFTCDCVGMFVMPKEIHHKSNIETFISCIFVFCFVSVFYNINTFKRFFSQYFPWFFVNLLGVV